jgi:hypothetical protein
MHPGFAMPEYGEVLTEGGRVPAGAIKDASPRVQVEVRRLPEGRLVARVEAAHHVILLVDPAAHRRPVEFLRQLEGVLQEAVTSQVWGRNQLIPPQPVGIE